MKVQLQGQTLRLRIDERELTALLAGGLIANLTRFGQGSGWGMELFLHEGSCVRLQAAEALRVWLPREDVAALQARLPSRDGLVFEIGQGAMRWRSVSTSTYATACANAAWPGPRR